jgi:hypothetical protein
MIHDCWWRLALGVDERKQAIRAYALALLPPVSL